MVGEEFVFAYGSLVHDRGGPAGVPVREAYLRDHRRAWGVAMENAVSLPGYKYYLDAADGSRPDVLVTFLDLLEQPGARVNGALLSVDAQLLPALDRRERNYERREVTASVELVAREGEAPGPRGRVWAYFGRPEARRRSEDGRRQGRAVVHRDYLHGVRAGFAALADGALAEFEASTLPHGCRVLALDRVELD